MRSKDENCTQAEKGKKAGNQANFLTKIGPQGRFTPIPFGFALPAR
jgi:hypothetical protein